MDSGANNVEWLKGRLTYRFKTKISHSLNKLVDEVNAILHLFSLFSLQTRKFPQIIIASGSLTCARLNS